MGKIRNGCPSAKRCPSINPFEDCFVKFGNKHSEEPLKMNVVLWDQIAFNRWNA